MAVGTHSPVKPEKLVNQYIGLVERQLLVPQLFARKSIDDYKGSSGDAVSVKVPGRLPARRYAFRNDRTNPIKLDTYSERKIVTTFGDLIYSASPITDEQKDFDGISTSSLLQPQSRAVAQEINQICVDKVVNSPFQVVIGGAATDLPRALVEARKVLNKLRQPDGGRFLLVGSDFEGALLTNDKLNLASNVGDVLAKSTFEAAILGSRYGFTIIRCDELPPKHAYAMSANAYILLTGAPSIPDGAVKGATTSYNGLALRWMQDYDFMYRYDRSSVDTYVGTQYVTDVFLKFDTATLSGDTTRVGEVVGTADYFVRAIKLTLDGTTSTGPAAGSPLAQDVGFVAADVWNG